MPGPVRHAPPDQVMGRYALFREIASGGMASVHLGRLMGPVGFSRVVAIKRLHPHLAKDPEFVTMFVDEARLAARVQHPNVVPTLDVVAEDQEILIVMEYVEGESLSKLARFAYEKREQIPIPIVVGVIIGALHGLHAAHEARDEDGRQMQLVHRDVSPQNILVGVDGLARVVDFGIAKVAGRGSRTASGVLKGKLAYMSPEQIKIEPLDRRTDIYALGVVMWELLAGRRLFTGENDWEIAAQIRDGLRHPPSAYNPGVSPELDALVLQACASDPNQRFATALEMADALEHAHSPATTRAIGRYVQSVAAAPLARRKELVAEAESVKSDLGVLATAPTEHAGTRPGGAFAPRVSEPPQPSTANSQIRAHAEAPPTAATWATAAQKHISPPVLGVIGGVVLALTLGIILVVVRLAGSDEGSVTAVEPSAEPAASSASSPTTPPPVDPTPLVEVEGTIVEEAKDASARPPVKPQGGGKVGTQSVPPPPPPPVTQPKPKNCEWVKYVGSDGEPRFKRVCPK